MFGLHNPCSIRDVVSYDDRRIADVCVCTSCRVIREIEMPGSGGSNRSEFATIMDTMAIRMDCRV